MNTINFTKRALESLETPDGKRYVVYHDSGERGLGLKIEPSGHRTFFWSRRVCKQLSWKTIGEYKDVSLDEARAEAAKYNRARVTWKQTGENPLARTSGITLREIIHQYIERHVKPKPRHPDHPNRGIKDIEQQRDRCLTAQLLDRKIASIRHAELVDLREAVNIKRGPCASNRLMNMLRAVITWSIKYAELWSGPNPALNIKKFPEKKRRRFLQKHELVALRDAVVASPNRDLQDFVYLALMTGARKSDILSMRWADLALDHGTWLVPAPKNAEPYNAILTLSAVEILRARREIVGANEWVFPSAASECGHLRDMKRAWGQLLRRAKLENLRQHDLRRALGSWQATGGASLLIIGKSLGHKTTAATQVYAQLQLDPVRASVEAATAAMFADTPKQLPAAPVAPAPKQLSAAPVAIVRKKEARKKVAPARKKVARR